MKPNEHIELPDDELITHIKEQLMAHEEDYAPGAWENFNSDKPTKKRGMFFWMGSMSSAAALILIGFAIFLMNTKKEGLKTSLLTVDKPANHQMKLPQDGTVEALKPAELSKEEREGRLANSAEVVTAQSAKAHTNAALLAGFSSNAVPKRNQEITVSKDFYDQGNPAERREAVNTLKSEQSNEGVATLNNSVVTALPHQDQKAVVAETRTELKPQNLEEFLAQESKNGNARGRKTNTKLAASAINEDKWEMGVMVAPSFGSSKKLNMGYGLSMGYALSKKVSINSGISYNEMGASRTAAPGGQDMMATRGLAGNSKELKAVDANLRGIDIPLEIRYRLTKSLYANVGISAFAVLNQKQKNTFLESQVQNSPMDPGNAASAAFKANILSTTVTEEKQTSDLKTDPYLGFYNFSLGYKQQISRGKSVSLEPFLKLPIKEFTQENLYLIGTGLRLKFDF